MGRLRKAGTAAAPAAPLVSPPRRVDGDAAPRTAAAAEILPLQIMLGAMRRAWAAAEQAEALMAVLTDPVERSAAEQAAGAARRLAQAWAKDCAPYLHPRVATSAPAALDAPAYVILGIEEAESEEAWTHRPQAVPERTKDGVAPPSSRAVLPRTKPARPTDV